MEFLWFILAWLVLSPVLAVGIGKFIRAGMREESEDEDERYGCPSTGWWIWSNTEVRFVQWSDHGDFNDWSEASEAGSFDL